MIHPPPKKIKLNKKNPTKIKKKKTLQKNPKYKNKKNPEKQNNHMHKTLKSSNLLNTE